MVRAHSQYLTVLIFWVNLTAGINPRSTSVAFLQVHQQMQQPEDGVEELEIRHGVESHDKCTGVCMDNPPCNVVVYDDEKQSCVLARVKGEGDIIMLDGKKSEVKEKEEVLAERGETQEELEKKQAEAKKEEEEAMQKKEDAEKEKKEADEKKAQ